MDASQVQTVFMSFDPEQKGVIKSSDFTTVLSQTGFASFTPKLQHNLLNIADYYGSGEVPFGMFSWLHGMLVAAQGSFNGKASNGVAPIASLNDIFTALSYNFHPDTVKLLQGITDRNKAGTFDFASLVASIAFICFARNNFNEADANQSGKLSLEQVEGKLPYLGLANASHDQALKIFQAADLDNSGTVEFEEFVGLVVKLKFPELA